MLNPDLLLTNINMQHTTMNTVRTIPPSINEFIVIVRFVKDHLDLHFARGEWGNTNWPIVPPED